MAHRKMPRKPKKPRTSAGLASWTRFDARVKEWQRKCAQIKTDANRKKALIKKHSK